VFHIHPGGVGTVVRLGQAEGDARLAGDRVLQEHVLLFLVAEAHQHVHEREVAHDGALVLQVVVQAQALLRQVLADDRHAQVRAAVAAGFLGQRIAQVAGLVGAAAHLAQQLFPLGVGLAVILPVGARVLAAMVEETDVVVLVLERLDLLLDEGVERVELGLNVGRNGEIHDRLPCRTVVARRPGRRAL
jgi:hypothetical protein